MIAGSEVRASHSEAAPESVRTAQRGGGGGKEVKEEVEQEEVEKEE